MSTEIGTRRWQAARPALFDPAREDFAHTAYLRSELWRHAYPGGVVVEQELVAVGPLGDVWKPVREETWQGG